MKQQQKLHPHHKKIETRFKIILIETKFQTKVKYSLKGLLEKGCNAVIGIIF
jgi:hypothetical protein